MCKEDEAKIINVLREHLDEKKYLSDWVKQINSISKRKEYTRRELAHLFKVIRCRDILSVEKTKYPPQYSFSVPVQVSEI
jgi:hypothetical protein